MRVCGVLDKFHLVTQAVPRFERTQITGSQIQFLEKQKPPLYDISVEICSDKEM